MKNHLKILSLFVAFILISSCVDTNTDSLNGDITESTQQLKYGTYAFKYVGLDAQEYLTFTLKNGDFKGTLFL